MLYHSTRNKNIKASSAEAILRGLAPDGGLYVPYKIEPFETGIEEFVGLEYKEVLTKVLHKFFDEFRVEDIKECINKAYDGNFDITNIVDIHKTKDRYYLELFHGKTLAFKDIALAILPHLMNLSKEYLKVNYTTYIVVATSGDTGKATLEAFSNIDGFEIFVIYPKEGVSKTQELQMITHNANNCRVFGIDGNFDDAQSFVKSIMDDDKLNQRLINKNRRLSAANSINIGRLIPQIAYYIYTCAYLIDKDEITKDKLVDFSVPTGNFGNILAGIYAKKLGANIGNLICASNKNNVLYDFFKTRVYNINRDFYNTNSPSMDILVSSNLERLIFDLYGEECTTFVMNELKSRGVYTINDLNCSYISSFYTSDNEVKDEIKRLFIEEGYIIDPHTAVASFAYNKFKESGNKTVIVSTASPYKFIETVLPALGEEDISYKKLENISGINIPKNLKNISKLKCVHNTSGNIKDIKEIIYNYIDS